MSEQNRDLQAVKPTAKKVKKFDQKEISAKRKLALINEAEQQFYKDFPKPAHHPLTAVLCIAALVFDFIVSRQSFHSLALMLGIPVELLALLFSCLDGGIAIMASGLLAHSMAEKMISRSRWRPVLWVMAGLKVTMFFIFVHIVNAETLETSWIASGLIVIFFGLIYTVLDLAGEGLWFGAKSLSFGIRKWILDDPDTMRIKKTQYLKKLDLQIQQLNTDQDRVYSFYELNHLLPNPIQNNQ